MKKFSSKRPLTDDEEAEIQRMIASDPHNTEATDEQIRQAQPFREAFPELAAGIDREKAKRGRPRVPNPRQQVSIRLDREVIAKFRATGPGWQTRINDVLKNARI